MPYRGSAGPDEDLILRYLLEAENEESDPDEPEHAHPNYDHPLEGEEEDHVSDSNHDSGTDVDDSDADPDYNPDDNRSRLQRIIDRRITRNTPDSVQQAGSSHDAEMVQEDPFYDSDIIPPSNEDEYQENINTMYQAQEHVTREIDSVDQVIEDVVMGLDTIDQVIEDVVAGAGDVRRGNPNILLGKDKVTRWNKQPVSGPSIRTRSVNIVRSLPGPVNEAKNAKTPLQCFQLFIDDEIFDTIVRFTNVFITSISGNFTYQKDCKTTDKTEVKSFFGLLLLAGVNRSGHQNVIDLWANDGFGIEAFYSTMKLNRFLFLLRCIRFDNLFDRAARRATDKFAAFREVFELFVKNCKRNYSLSSLVTIDEQLVAFRGRCPFRQFMKNKPAKYGIKIFTLTDARMFFVKSMEVYLGTQPNESPFQVSNKPHDVVLRLAECIEGTGRNITADNWFSSVPLVDALLKKNLTYVGTLRKDKTEIPPQLVTKKRDETTSIFAFSEDASKKTVVSYAPKKNRCVLLISSMHHDAEIDDETGDQKKPSIITFYNSTKSGVDVIDEKSGTYSTSRRTRRWPMVLMFRLLDIGGINSEVIHKFNNIRSPEAKMTRRAFLKEIGMSLIKPQIDRRTAITHLPRELRMKMHKIAGTDPPVAQNVDIRISRMRCNVCPRKLDRKTKYKCHKCQTPLCQSHMKDVCETCFSGLDAETESE